MSIVSDVRTAFGSAPDLDGEYSRMERSMKIYRGNAPWLRVKRSGLHSRGERRMFSMNTAKAAADELTALVICEGAELFTDVPEYTAYINEVLEENGFHAMLPDFFSKAFMSGGGAVTVKAGDGFPELSVISAENFLPISWNSREITEAVFRTAYSENGRLYTLLERFSSGENGCPVTESRLFKKERFGAALGSEIPEAGGVFEYRGVTGKLFSCFRPAVSGGYDGSPVGCGVMDLALDTLRALDIAFDSMAREFILGKKRIIVPYSCIRTVTDPETGAAVRYFDADDEAFVALKADDRNDLQVTDNTCVLRIEEHVSAIKALLNILCFQLGISSEALAFDSMRGLKTIKTATEVISQDSKTARTVHVNRKMADAFFKGLAEAIISVGICTGRLTPKPYSVTVGWRDGVIIDDGTVISENIRLVEAGLRSRERAVMEINKCDKTAAEEELSAVAEGR
ncbi:MAG: phage portal protein [Ruminococcus sp.]|nr:phage portal protein [Ruminococcus sp.]